jgi:O-antigen ligase
VNEAHNDYLQLLVEMGLVGFGIMLWFLINLIRRAIRKLPDWPNEIGGAVALACLMGCVGILVHSFVDFNLEVQANAAWFYVLCALAASPHPIESRQRVRRARSRSQEPDLEDPGAQQQPLSPPANSGSQYSQPLRCGNSSLAFAHALADSCARCLPEDEGDPHALEPGV